MGVTFESSVRDSVIGEGGKAIFINKQLFDISWRPRETLGPGEGDGLTLRAANIHEFPRLMRFLRAVEKAHLKNHYGARVLASNGKRLWMTKKQDADLGHLVAHAVEIYKERYGMEPNVLILSYDDPADTFFWKGKVQRLATLLPISFILSYEPEDGQEGG